jgi:hypothetical protein
VINAQKCVKVPGLKYPRRVKTAQDEQIIVPVPAIVSVEMQEEVIQNLQRNKQLATRNNKQKVPALMRGGLAKCGNCGRTALAHRVGEIIKKRKEATYYNCRTASTHHECKRCFINAKIVDKEVWNAALEIINDPNKVDKALEEQKSKDPTASRRKQLNKELKKLQDEREALQVDLIRMSKARMLDRSTEERLAKELKELERQEQGFNGELQTDEIIRKQWDKTQKELQHLHQKCIKMQEKLKEPTYEPSYKDKRDMIEFFGMTVILWEEGHINPKDGKPQRIKIEARFADIDLQLR